jgi:hypothetical protein
MNQIEQEFTVYFKNGKRSVIKGTSMEDAFIKAKYRVDVVPLIDWLNRGNTDTHIFLKETKNWVRRRAEWHDFRYAGSSASGHDTYYKCVKCGTTQTGTEPHPLDDNQRLGCEGAAA